MKRFLVLVLAALVLVSCSKKEVKKESEDSKKAAEAVAVVEALKDAYLAANPKLIEAQTTREGYRTILSSLKRFDSAELEFTPVWLEIEGSQATLNVSWKGKWLKGGKSFEEQGMAVFLLTGRPLKVDNVQRASPFVYPD